MAVCRFVKTSDGTKKVFKAGDVLFQVRGRTLILSDQSIQPNINRKELNMLIGLQLGMTVNLYVLTSR